MAVTPRSDSERHQMYINDEAMGLATQLSMSDVKSNRTGPPPPSQTPLQLKELITTYMIVLRELFGNRNEHYRQCERLRAALAHKPRSFKGVDVHSVKSVVWTIVEDTREYFSQVLTVSDTQLGNFPTSSLGITILLLQ